MTITLGPVTDSGDRTRLTTCFDQNTLDADVNDSENWSIAVNSVRQEFQRLTGEQATAVNSLVSGLTACKAELTLIFDSLSGGDVCRLCKGECCRAGRYHFTVVDLLVYLSNAESLFTPRFDNGACPYLGDEGCLMPPVYRPYNCLTFVCDRVDGGMRPDQHEYFSIVSERLLACYREFERLFHNRFMGGLLHNVERLEGLSTAILWGARGNSE